MQHLGELYNQHWVTAVEVAHSKPFELCRMTEANPSCSSATFFSRSPWGLKAFYHFPNQHGFRIGKDYNLLPESNPSCADLPRSTFLQAWLFFALIYSVLRDDNGLLTHDDLFSNGKLDTKELPKALDLWHDYIMKLYDNDRLTAIWKLFEANQILELAKRVVLANLAEKSPSLLSPNADRTPQGSPDDGQSLCIMVLGETLSAVLKTTIERCGLRVTGWEGDDGGGWGPSSYVSNQMLENKWCPRSQAVVEGQLGRNATLLYVTAQAQRGNRHNIHRQTIPCTPCTSSTCGFIEAESKGPYSPLHYPACTSKDCMMIGPDTNSILDILEMNERNPNSQIFPVMRIQTDKKTKQLVVTVKPWNKDTRFVTISHVWSQGLGNKMDEKVRTCQLRAIQDLLSKVSNHEEHPFWLDTFAIPQKRKDKGRSTRLKRVAIGLIHQVFKNAEHCIVIDRHLVSIGRQFNSCSSVGAMLLASGWMMRLWTLQEAFVSRRLHLAMGQSEQGTQEIQDLTNLWSDNTCQKVLNISLREMMRTKVDQSLMRVEPNTTLLMKSTTERALLIASAWDAVRYRTTGNPAEETLALLSLLGIPIPEDVIDKMLSSPQHKDLEWLMQRFWTAIGKHHAIRKSIPSGIIFLPGKKLSQEGYRWAPTTWMSGQVEGYPFPLKSPKYPTELTHQGLIVHYPGFLLHPTKDKLRAIISTQKTRNEFKLCVGRGLDEWYGIVAAGRKDQLDGPSPASVDDGGSEQWLLQNLLDRLNSNEPLKIGLVISRPRPAPAQGEIGLLVEIYKDETYDFDEGHPIKQGSMLYCRIIRRVEVRRLSSSDVKGSEFDLEDWLNPILRKYEDFSEKNVVGVQLDETQSWCVDGFELSPPERQSEALPQQSQQDIIDNFKRIVQPTVGLSLMWGM